ncbi:MAG TPA: translation initiation factor IF-2 [Lacunisphaera sp.]|jgi:hypothetical protein|nr:translation initiation factor IF-2 [Lacunisphaera sp.]HQY05701.1 translation initiation factor IF-2 [Lacunisphaera sp.]
MSSTESSGAPAEATATTPAPDAAFPTFGSTRGSGLARGKRPAAGPAASTAASPEYTPTAIEVVNAPREYQNPFAPAETPDATAPAPKPFEPAPVVITPAPAREYSAPVADVAPAASVQNDEPAELNILEPAQQKTAPPQTWESEGFKPAREPRGEREPRTERPRREERAERPADEPVDIASIPPQFLYVRPGHTYVPTPRNMGGAPRERGERPERSERPSAPIHGSPARAMETSAEVPAQSGGFFGWLKSLFGGSASAETAAAPSANGEHRRDGGGQRRHRGGRNRGGQGGGGQGGYQGGGEGGRGRGRGGRGRSGGGGGYRSEGSSQGGV